MTAKKQPKYVWEIAFGSVILLVLLAIVIPPFLNTGSNDSSHVVDSSKEGIDVPIASHDPTLGEHDAPVTIVEFIDYQCPSCRMSAEETFPVLKEQYIDQGEVQYVLKDFPLGMHEHAIPAALAARAAGEQDKYWEMHDLLFEGQSDWADQTEEEAVETFISFAEQLDLDIEKFREDMQNETLMDHVAEGRNLGEQLEIRYTPTLFINGKMYEQPIPPTELERVIEEAKSQGDEP